MTKRARDTKETSWTCSCNREFEQTGLYCHQCGEARQTHTCSNCGNDKIDETKHKFCDQCGTKVTILPNVQYVTKCAWLDLFLRSAMFEYHKECANAIENNICSWVVDELMFKREFAYFMERHMSVRSNQKIPRCSPDCTHDEFRVALNKKGCLWDDTQKIIYGLRINIEKARKIEELESQNFFPLQRTQRRRNFCPHRLYAWCTGEWSYSCACA
jgi:hypothetical protein